MLVTLLRLFFYYVLFDLNLLDFIYFFFFMKTLKNFDLLNVKFVNNRKNVRKYMSIHGCVYQQEEEMSNINECLHYSYIYY